jgi:RimJ/RimL family protein N-acetyltransferase
MASAPTKQPTFVTKRLRVRPFRARDGAALHLLYGDAENLRYWGTDPSASAQRTQRG